MIAALKVRLAAAPRDAGISLAELLVSMMVTALLLAMTGGFIASAYKAGATTREVDASTREASTAMTEITRSLRAAGEYKPSSSATEVPAFVSAGATGLVVYSYINLQASVEAPVRVQFTLAGGVLTETRWVGVKATPTSSVYTFPTRATSVVRLTDSVVFSDPRNPVIFTYLDEQRRVIRLDGTGQVAARESIAFVTVTLQVGESAGSSDATLLSNTVSLNNLALWRETT